MSVPSPLGFCLAAVGRRGSRSGTRISEEKSSNWESSNSELREAAGTIQNLRQTITALRVRGYALAKQVERAKDSLSEARANLSSISTFTSTEHRVYTPAARKLYCDLKDAGCRNFELAIAAFTEATGVVFDRIMSDRTGGRAQKEQGLYSMMQLGREIANAPAFGESTDGTAMHGITYQSTHVTLLAPTYDPNIDINDKSTWTYQTRFVSATPLLNHTAETQLKASLEIVASTAKIYSNSPLATRDGHKYMHEYLFVW
ncbi:hypothetical protein BT96DRAFT_995150 [Gymnopus androsaceus JB14]|uniref:Uncharacterized protein n=1 Tax=Gymnopus androsaceus JB14 TaxID=1447944 RepID=A0A6A4HMR2_9AGAR|nr:hypothetical protein BT96DRAFT_995150 [Gymnopus androsaceus JB14]